MILLTRAKNHYSCSILDKGISSFCYSYSINDDRLHDQHYLSESSPSLTDPNYLQNQGSNLDTLIKQKQKYLQNHHLSKGYLL